MNKDKYFSISKKKDLSPRCPLIGICERWAQTIFYYQFYDSISFKDKEFDFVEILKEESVLDAATNLSIVVNAEFPEFLRVEDRISFRDMCPEVNLFDAQNSLINANETACVSGEIDMENKKYNKDVFNCIKEKHYSECLEFSQFVFSHLDKKKISKFYVEKKKRRVPISNKLRFEIFQRDKFTCKYCGRSIDDGITLEIDHVIPIAEGGTDEFKNLVTACKECNNGKSNKII